MTTQLIIDGVETVLPQNFSCTVKRENSFFTKSGEYTYDATLNLDNPVNNALYSFLHRFNKKEPLDTRRSAVLIADGHVYCRGTEVVTRWTEQTVTIQIVSGESELNYFIGQDQKIEDLDLGEIEGPVYTLDNTKCYPEVEYCLPTVLSTSGNFYNRYGSRGSGLRLGRRTGDNMGGTAVRPQPYLCALVNKILTALGYTVGTNQLEQTQFKNLFLVNTVYTTEFAKMVPGWTVKEFLTEVEKLTGVVFITDNMSKTCDIVQKTIFYQDAQQFTIRNVIDAYETEVEDDDSRTTEFSSSDVSYDLPDHYWSKLMKLPEGFLESATIVEIEMPGHWPNGGDRKTVYHDATTDRYYIKLQREYSTVNPEPGTDTDDFFIEIDQFKNLDREGTTSTLELKITPAPMMWLGNDGCEIIDIGTTDKYKDTSIDTGEEEETDENSDDVENVIRSFEKTESSAENLYCAFHNGSVIGNRCPIAYTDAYHATQQPLLYQRLIDVFTGPEGSLRLQDLDEGYYQGGYEIDTRHAWTVETYDPNVIDPRQVYVIRNRRFVCRDVEEVITAQGRQKKWKGTFYPITLSDEGLEHRWVLTHGVWDDHAAWLDDGRWNDSDPN